MVFFKNKDSQTDNWKEKYLQLLDNQERSDKQQQATEDLLCKTIIRLTLAVKGLNKALDPHLDRLRDMLRSRLKNERLPEELQAFTNALIAMEDTPEVVQLSAGLLFDFLAEEFPEIRTDLDHIQKQYENREILNHQQLFINLAALLPLKNSSTTPAPCNLNSNECKAIGSQLIRLLDAADLPDHFIEESNRLKMQLLDGQPLLSLFDDTIALFIAVKSHIDVEQQELASFLTSLTVELTELGVKASGINLANEDSNTRRSALDHELSSQMADLQKKSATATQLEPLKQLINLRLASIGQQLNQHNIQEQKERSRMQIELRSLSQKISNMESETSELQVKLESAMRRATIDSLTNLPNRHAFNERLKEEIARSRRHGPPLSLAVWDIDYFKAINDAYGHKSGDKALLIIAKILSQHCRKSDFIARYGGEEFVMLFPETKEQDAFSVANKLREIVESSSFNANGNPVRITLSCGITQLLNGDTNESFFERADKALYTAKHIGRNKCVLA